jgi:hypothetical protein
MSKCNLSRNPVKAVQHKSSNHLGNSISDEKVQPGMSKPELDLAKSEELDPERTPLSTKSDDKNVSNTRGKFQIVTKLATQKQTLKFPSPKSILKKAPSQALTSRLNSPKVSDSGSSAIDYMLNFSPSPRSNKSTEKELSQTTETWCKFSKPSGPIIDKRVLYDNLKQRIREARLRSEKAKRAKSRSPVKSIPVSPSKLISKSPILALSSFPVTPKSTSSNSFASNSPSSIKKSQSRCTQTPSSSYKPLSPHNANFGFPCGFDLYKFLKRSRDMNK